MLKFAVKVGLASTAVYYLNQEGIWRDSSQSLKAYDKLNTFLEPHIADVKKQLPFEIPAIPEEISNCAVMKQGWNKGVTSTFVFIGQLPGKVSTWTSNGIETLLQNPEIQKLINGTNEQTQSLTK